MRGPIGHLTTRLPCLITSSHHHLFSKKNKSARSFSSLGTHSGTNLLVYCQQSENMCTEQYDVGPALVVCFNSQNPCFSLIICPVAAILFFFSLLAYQLITNDCNTSLVALSSLHVELLAAFRTSCGQFLAIISPCYPAKPPLIECI